MKGYFKRPEENSLAFFEAYGLRFILVGLGLKATIPVFQLMWISR
jgi:hypothetical protein